MIFLALQTLEIHKHLIAMPKPGQALQDLVTPAANLDIIFPPYEVRHTMLIIAWPTSSDPGMGPAASVKPSRRDFVVDALLNSNKQTSSAQQKADRA